MGKVSLGVIGCLICAAVLGACVKPVDFRYLLKDGVYIIGNFEPPMDNAPHVVWVIDGDEVELTDLMAVSTESKITVARDKDITVKVQNYEDYENEIEWFGGESKGMPLYTGHTYTVGVDNAGKNILQQAAVSGSYSITAVGDYKYSTLFHIVVDN